MAIKTIKKSVGRELVEKSGGDVEKLLDLLMRNASAKLTTVFYNIHRVNGIGLEGEGLKQITEDSRIEVRNHFEALVPRIYEFGGHIPHDMVEFHNIFACPPAKLPADPRNINAMLEVLLRAEQCAAKGYTSICNMTFGKDHRTYDLSLARSCTKRSSMNRGLQSFWDTDRAVASREGRPNSPYVSKFLNAGQ